ncbi:NAD(P)-binding Rossmann-fold containing protein-13 [Coleophoma crateriformis]|uniref:NAD(P)-binding Rossmann-fold containing protein-13 n=1 Tax=Coleophoma crateriformis TaxID=565419 RepID=A0A3D8QB96_9HELO|nr:NAD(P)-binding Rossmann-fold containing protein-13 [Coleophoma crateriformis]
MATYAVLGATGATGHQTVLHLLALSPEIKIHVYVRSKPKLLHLLPQVANNKNVRIFEGSMNDTALLTACIASTKAVFAVIASNENAPGLSIAQDSAAAVLASMRRLQQESNAAKLPRIVVLSAVMVNKRLCEKVSWLEHLVIYHAFWHIYQDLEKAESLYAREAEKGSLDLDVRFVQPGALIQGGKSGIVTISEVDRSEPISYADLAEAMVQVANLEGAKPTNVAVVVEGSKLQIHPTLLLTVLEGLLWTFIPRLYGLFQYFHLK